jgi:NitT/TauT family transport system permease protein
MTPIPGPVTQPGAPPQERRDTGTPTRTGTATRRRASPDALGLPARYGWIGVIVAFLLLWWLTTATGTVDSPLVPSPSRLLDAAREVSRDGRLWLDVRTTLGELAVSVGVFVVVGTVLGVAMGSGERRFGVFNGPVATWFAMPKITVLPVFVLAFGLGFQQKVLFGALYGVFPLVMNTMTGARAVRTVHTQLFDAVGAGPVFRTIRLTIPSMLPYFLTGLRIGYVYAGIGVLLAEMYVSTAGLGQALISAADQPVLDQFWVFVLASSALLVVGAGILGIIEYRLAKWRV